MHPPNPSQPFGAQHMVPMSHQNPWPAGGQSASPTRQSKGRPRGSPDSMMGPGIFPMSDVMCGPIGMDVNDMDVFMTSQGVGPGPDDDSRTRPSGGSSVNSRDKGRGSYRCGRVSDIFELARIVLRFRYLRCSLTKYDLFFFQSTVRSAKERTRVPVSAEAQASSGRASSRNTKRCDSGGDGRVYDFETFEYGNSRLS
jgi:hypothetical protein